MRMTLEAAYWEEFHNEYSWFLTLTYEDNHLPLYGTLSKDDIQNFFKRLRWYFGTEKLRYYVVGEYGSQCPDHELIDCPKCGSLQRPHYHAIIFGWSDLPSKVLTQGKHGPIYHSDTIQKAWTKRDNEGNKSIIGKHELEPCNFETCAYVARYVMKKQTGDPYHVADHYCKYIWQTDTWVDLPPEFAMMSKNPGIGKMWLDEFMHDSYAQDEIGIPGRCNISKPPRYFDQFYEKANPDHMAEIKEDRRKAMARSLAYGPSLESRAKVEDAWLKLTSRDLC